MHRTKKLVFKLKRAIIKKEYENNNLEGRRMKMMIVDDDPVSRSILVRVLFGLGKCVELNNGTDALTEFESKITTEDRYNLVTLDISMPDISGITVLYKMRKIEEQYAIAEAERAKIVMVTADGNRNRIKTAIEEKCTYYLVKPFNKEDVLEKFRKQQIIS